MRRIIIAARLESSIQAASLRKLEDRLGFAFDLLRAMADHILQDFQSHMDAPDACVQCLKYEYETEVLMLKAAMARLGMGMPRQRLIDEYFRLIEDDGTSSVGLTDGVGGSTDPAPDSSTGVALTGNASEDIDMVSEDGFEVDCEEHKEMNDAEQDDWEYSAATQRQTCITDYYAPCDGR